MNTTTIADAGRTLAWREIPVRDLRSVRMRLIKKFNTLSQAATELRIPYMRLSHALNGRENLIWVIAIIQTDIELSNHQVLMLWPLLKTWPKESRRAA